MAKQKVVKKEGEKDAVFTTRRGIAIECKPPDFVFIQTIQDSVTIPEVPTYSVKVGLSGKTQTHVMDAKVVEQAPEYADAWGKYLLAKDAAESEQAMLSLRAAFLTGTVAPDYIDDDAWRRKQRLVGAKLPEDPEEAWMYYLFSGAMEPDEYGELFIFIMRQIPQVPDEVLDSMEGTFRANLQAKPGSEKLADAEGDTREVADGEVVA